MKRIAAAVVFACVGGASAMGGVISFDPSDVVLDRNVDPLVFTMDLSITSTDAPEYNAVDVFVGSDTLALTDFALNTPGVTRFFENNAPNTDYYASGFSFGYFGSASPTPQSQLLGTLTVDATGLPDGTYYIYVNNDTDQGGSKLTAGATVDPLFGTASVTIVPEPATLALLGFGAVALIRRRRTA